MPHWLKCLLLALALLALPGPAGAQYNFITNAGGGSVTLALYSGTGGAVTIPGTFNSLPVTDIGTNAFAAAYNTLTSVTIPNSVTNIGSNAFGGCYVLTNVTLPSNLATLGASAFSSCAMTNISLPATVTNIGQAPFAACAALQSINVNAANANYSSTNGALFDKAQLNLIQYPAGLAGSYSMPGTVTNIGVLAFEQSALSNVTIPNSVTTIGPGAFYHASGIATVSFGSGITSIGNDGFYYCSSLQNISLPASLTTIGEGAFEECLDLTNVTIPAGVTNIQQAAFSPCQSLTNIGVAPLNTAYSSVGGVLFDYGVKTLVEYPTAGPVSYTVPDGVTSIADYAFYDCTSLSSVLIPNSVTNIGVNTFASCHGLTGVTLSTNLLSLGNDAFELCPKLTNIVIPDAVVSIGNSAFSNDTGVTNASLGAGVTNLGAAAFGNCSALANFSVSPSNQAFSSSNGVLLDKLRVNLLLFPPGLAGNYTIPGSVTNCDNGAFAECRAVASVTFGSGLLNLGAPGFYLCTALTNISVSASNPVYSSTNGVLFDKAQRTLLQYPIGRTNAYTIPDGVTSIGTNAFYEAKHLSNVTFPNSVTNIALSAFVGCPLTNLTLPDELVAIGQGAFQFTHLTNVVIPASLLSLGDGAFEYCASLESAYFAGVAPYDYGDAFESTSATVYYLPGTPGWSAGFGAAPTAPWVLPYPVILGFVPGFGVQANRFAFTVSWATNLTLVVEAATNLANPVWQPIQTNTLSGGTAVFSDPNWANYHSRFYRARTP